MKTTVVVKERMVVATVAAREGRVDLDRMTGVREVERVRVVAREERARVVLMMVILGEEEEENLVIMDLVKDLMMVTLVVVVANPDLMMDTLEVATEEVGTLMMVAMEAVS